MQCDTCVDAAENCTLCSNGFNRTNITPECNCLDGFYDSNFTIFNCLPCLPECSTCSEFNICIECKSNLNRILNSKSLQCECEEGY